MFWKTTLAILSGLGFFLTAVLDYHWRDKRRKEFKWGKKGLLAILGLLSIVGVIAVAVEGETHEKEARRLSAELSGLRSGQVTAEAAARRRASDQSAEISSLKDLLAPFLQRARKASPNTDDATALRSLSERLDRLEYATQDRVLAPSQETAMVSLLRPFRGTPVQLYVMGSDGESRRYIYRLKTCLVSSGWAVQDIQFEMAVQYPPGLAVVVSQNKHSPPQEALIAALRLTGQRVTTALGTRIPEGTFRVVVGPKPGA